MLFPIFWHCYIDILTKFPADKSGCINATGRMMDEYSKDHALSRARELAELRARCAPRPPSV